MAVTAGQRITAAVLNALPGDLVSFTTGSVTNSTSETTIGTWSAAIPANDAVLGSGYQFLVTGTTDNAATPTLELRIYVNSAAAGNLVYDTGSQTMAGAQNTKSFSIKAWMIITATGSSGTFETFGLANSNNITATPLMFSKSAASINTTISNDVILTAKWGTQSSSNTARSLAGSVQRT